MSAMQGSGVSRSAGVKRLMQEAKELHKPTNMFYARPLDDNLFEWHFTLRGPPDTEYEGGIYHGRIILPHEYPMKPPNVVMLTPNGRFQTNTKVCLSISGYHPETWLPSWSIRTAILALIGFFPTDGVGAVGALNCTPDIRRKMAKESLDFHCETCGCTMRDILPESDDETVNQTTELGESGDTTTTKPGHPSTSPSPSTAPAENSAASATNNNNTPQPVQRPALPSTITRPANRAPQTPIPLSMCAFAICICFAAFMGLLARRLTF